MLNEEIDVVADRAVCREQCIEERAPGEEPLHRGRAPCEGSLLPQEAIGDHLLRWDRSPTRTGAGWSGSSLTRSSPQAVLVRTRGWNRCRGEAARAALHTVGSGLARLPSGLLHAPH